MPIVVTILLVSVVGYLAGSLPVANTVARHHAQADLRSVGDRNPGYWNAKEQLGPRIAAAVMVGDVAKGAAAAGFGRLLAGDGRWWVAYVAVAAAMVGHAWPVFAGFRGGRSVLTFVGGALVVAPLPAAAAVAVTIAGSLGLRSFAWGARIGFVAYPILQLVIEDARRTAASGALMTLIGLRFAQAALASRTRSATGSERAGG